jgi:hypothetical protein
VAGCCSCDDCDERDKETSCVAMKLNFARARSVVSGLTVHGTYSSTLLLVQSAAWSCKGTSLLYCYTSLTWKGQPYSALHIARFPGLRDHALHITQ